MPRSAVVSSSLQDRQSIMFECTESNALRPLPQKKGPSVIFNIQQWERQTASIKRQRSIPSILTASLHQWELLIHHSVISATKSISTQCGNQCWEHGSTHGSPRWESASSSLNWEIATASPINHNEATSGSVDTEIVLHLRRVSG